jgi:hypothetical protein
LCMPTKIRSQLMREKAVELAFAAKSVIQQMAMRDYTPEGLAAAEMLEGVLTRAISNNDGLDLTDAPCSIVEQEVK